MDNKHLNTRGLGSGYEQLAAEYLEKEGLQIIEMNYRVRIGEIDIIAKDGEYLVFVEVKYRACRAQGGAAYAISQEKKRRITRVAQWYLAQHRISQNTFCRFDAVLIDRTEVTHIKNAW